MLTLGFDAVFDQLLPQVTIDQVTVSASEDVDGKGLGDFSSLWEYLSSNVSTDEPITIATGSDVDELSKCLSTKQKKQLRKRELRKRKRQAAHEAAEASVPSVEDVPEMGDYSTATEADEDILASSDDDTSAEERLASLRSTLVTATKAFHTTNPYVPRIKRSHADRLVSLRDKLSARFPQDQITSTSTAMTKTSLAFQETRSKSSLGQTHIFVDSSNIYLGFQAQLQSLYPLSYPSHSQHKAVMDLYLLDTILERGRQSRTKSLVGSSPLLQSWDDAARRDYEVSILQRVSTPDHAGKREQGVDELLHMKMMESLLDADKAGTMVLATGDANVAQFSGGFFNVVLRALSRGWRVEVWAFRKSVNRLWLDRQFRQEYAEMFSINFLDEYIDELEM